MLAGMRVPTIRPKQSSGLDKNVRRAVVHAGGGLGCGVTWTVGHHGRIDDERTGEGFC